MEIEHGNLEDLFSAVVCALLGVVVQEAGGLDLRPGFEVVLAVAALDTIWRVSQMLQIVDFAAYLKNNQTPSGSMPQTKGDPPWEV